jgi:predicted TIM-barrel fold metal-dependent hydrolase
VVATNGGQINISGLGQVDAELALAENANLVVQTTGVYREDFLEGVVRRFGPERLLYASGFPHFDPRLEVLRVRWAPNLDDHSRGLVLGGNAERLLR